MGEMTGVCALYWMRELRKKPRKLKEIEAEGWRLLGVANTENISIDEVAEQVKQYFPEVEYDEVFARCDNGRYRPLDINLKGIYIRHHQKNSGDFYKGVDIPAFALTMINKPSRIKEREAKGWWLLGVAHEHDDNVSKVVEQVKQYFSEVETDEAFDPPRCALFEKFRPLGDKYKGIYVRGLKDNSVDVYKDRKLGLPE